MCDASPIIAHRTLPSNSLCMCVSACISQRNRPAGDINVSYPGGASGEEPVCQCRRCKRCGFDPWIRKIPWRRAWKLTPVFLPGEPHGAWRATVHSFTRSQTRLKGLSMHAHTHTYFFLPKSYYKCKLYYQKRFFKIFYLEICKTMQQKCTFHSFHLL